MKNKIKKVLNSNILRHKYVKYGLLLTIGLFLGWLFFGNSSGNHNEDEHGHVHELTDDTVWTCSMHPQIKMEKPGKCPICAMDLIPLKKSGSGGDAINPDAIQMSDEAIALANIQTTLVGRQHAVKEIQLYGTIRVDERLSQSQTSHVNGRIEKLYVNFTGESIKQGQTIASVYSPDLLNAQQELLEALKMQPVQPMLVEASKEKLRLWKLTDNQIDAIIKSGKVNPVIDIKSNTNGVVISKNVSQGDYINQGTVLLQVANLSQVWAMFDAYEMDLPFLKVGDKLEFTLQAIPGRTFSGKISFIDPLLDKTTRTSKVRVVTSNPGMLMKPEMYAVAKVNASLRQQSDEIVIPKSAVLWTGKRSIVYVKQPDTETPAFMLREIELGPSLGSSYVVLSGLHAGDEIVTNGAFSIDATAQLEGKRSMMNAEAAKPVTGHEKHSMNVQPGSMQSKHEILKVQGLCEMCKDRIEKTAKSVAGVSSATWDMKTRELHLNFDAHQTNLKTISKSIAKAGHETNLDKADQEAYDALPGCCKYKEN